MNESRGRFQRDSGNLFARGPGSAGRREAQHPGRIRGEVRCTEAPIQVRLGEWSGYGADPGGRVGGGSRRVGVESEPEWGELGAPGQRLRPPRPPPGLTQHEVGQLRVLQVVHHDHSPGKSLRTEKRSLGSEAEGLCMMFQVVLAQEGQRRHRDALELALQLLGRIHVAGGVASTVAGPQQQASRAQSLAKAILSPGRLPPSAAKVGRQRAGRGERASERGRRGGWGGDAEPGKPGPRTEMPLAWCRAKESPRALCFLELLIWEGKGEVGGSGERRKKEDVGGKRGRG